MERALLAGADLVGVNNRDLRSLRVDIAVTERLAPLLPADVLLVSESGIWGAADAGRAAAAGAAAVLVGESLVRCPHGSLPGLVNSLHGPHRMGLEVER
jgi:indole-3-glycerol phosphate synthase